MDEQQHFTNKTFVYLFLLRLNNRRRIRRLRDMRTRLIIQQLEHIQNKLMPFKNKNKRKTKRARGRKGFIFFFVLLSYKNKTGRVSITFE